MYPIVIQHLKSIFVGPLSVIKCISQVFKYFVICWLFPSSGCAGFATLCCADLCRVHRIAHRFVAAVKLDECLLGHQFTTSIINSKHN